MDFELDDDQRAVQDAVSVLLERKAGPDRARMLGERGGYDTELDDALDEAGFLDLAAHEDAGPLQAALVVEAVARAAGTNAIGARALVAPGVTDQAPAGPVALAVDGSDAPVRFGAHARTLLVAGESEARLRELEPGEAEPVASSYGYPMARVPTDGGVSLGEGSAERLRDWWRLAIATEAVGTMTAAFDLTVDHVKGREQFGRPIGSFQAIQHRLAEAAVSIEGARWLCYEAAWRGAPAEESALAAASATAAAKSLGPELHQLTGAIGFTVEYDLHVWTMRLQVLRLELDGIPGHARAAARARWPVPS